MRGTNILYIASFVRSLGSSPHTRDKLWLKKAILFMCRITPAFAGQMKPAMRYMAMTRDHPRIRGTNLDNPYFMKVCEGSPPHSRDKSFRSVYPFLYFGIIPAYAGQIGAKTPANRARWDHPRIRGTNAVSVFFFYAMPGSSPHTRDTYVYHKGS